MSSVSLSIPAEPSFARSVRMLAANLGVLAGLSLDAVEDARMAAEEAFVLSCATKPASCNVSFDVREGGLGMEFSLGASAPAADDQASAYAQLILSAVCDEYALDRAAGALRLVLSSDVADA